MFDLLHYLFQKSSYTETVHLKHFSKTQYFPKTPNRLIEPINYRRPVALLTLNLKKDSHFAICYTVQKIRIRINRK